MMNIGALKKAIESFEDDCRIYILDTDEDVYKEIVNVRLDKDGDCTIDVVD